MEPCTLNPGLVGEGSCGSLFGGSAPFSSSIFLGSRQGLVIVVFEELFGANV